MTDAPLPDAPRTAVRTGADALAESLIAAGVGTVFGVPGDTGVAFYDALYWRTDRLRHVLARDERHAVAMADAYGRVTGRPGVVEVSSGGGTTYAVGGMGEAFASGVPLVLITSDIHRASRGTGALTEIDQVKLFSAVTKKSYVVEDADDVPRIVADAFHEAVSGHPGPVAIIVPEDVLDEHVEQFAARTPDPRSPIAPDPLRIAEAVELLQGATRPAVIAGSGVHSSEAYAALASVAGKIGAGIATTIHGRGAIEDGHPLSLGLVGNNGGQPGANEVLGEADVALLVGTRANATDTNGFTTPARGACRIIRIDVDPARAAANYPDALQIVGDAKRALEGIDRALKPIGAEQNRIRLARVEAAREDRFDPRTPPGGAGVRDGELIPSDVVELVASLLPEGTPIVADPGTPTPNVANYWPVAAPGRRVIIPRGHGPMGYAIPAAIGLAFSVPGSPIVSVTADGSFAMSCGELETAARFELPVLFIQFTNHSFGWIKMLQHLYYEGRYFGVDPGTIDPVPIAEASGMRGVRVHSLAELERVVREFAADPAPTYVDVIVPHMIEHTPPVPAWVKAIDGDSTRPIY
ncbi:thiamine pyrophosphate-binding protein [Leucobacter sp. wl10]|uniref:thiamine pyrophosphate-binding protein n=1 Tax=Leucobacter sp. wl10 TaxID=2304677 RepID=UPI000E5BB058|nr:thiamine pyrophosphate-binding protein [Leucobacter sp. wl10]RGE19171.1 thiamine pyrophosphate-binding protein [Leucobacter sp. wl10]